MKITNLYPIVLLLGILTSCKKDEPKPSQSGVQQKYRLKHEYSGFKNNKPKMLHKEYLYSNNLLVKIKYYDTLGFNARTDDFIYDTISGKIISKHENFYSFGQMRLKFNIFYDSQNRKSFYTDVQERGDIIITSDTIATFSYNASTNSVMVLSDFFIARYTYPYKTALNYSRSDFFASDNNTINFKNEYKYDNMNNPYGNNYQYINLNDFSNTNNIIEINKDSYLSGITYKMEYTYEYKNNYPIFCHIETYNLNTRKVKIFDEYAYYEYELIP